MKKRATHGIIVVCGPILIGFFGPIWYSVLGGLYRPVSFALLAMEGKPLDGAVLEQAYATKPLPTFGAVYLGDVLLHSRLNQH
jgi:hypothetical protein